MDPELADSTHFGVKIFKGFWTPGTHTIRVSLYHFHGNRKVLLRNEPLPFTPTRQKYCWVAFWHVTVYGCFYGRSLMRAPESGPVWAWHCSNGECLAFFQHAMHAEYKGVGRACFSAWKGVKRRFPQLFMAHMEIVLNCNAGNHKNSFQASDIVVRTILNCHYSA